MLDYAMSGRLASSEKRSARYVPPVYRGDIPLSELLTETHRPALEAKQFDLLKSGSADRSLDGRLFCSGDLSLLQKPCVAIVGSRAASSDGIARATRLARELSEAGFVVVSGLAQGIDFAAHTAAIEAGGSTVAVIGTPLDKAYPAENARLQEQIYSEHLLLSPFASGEKTFKSSFPKRNRVMAAITDATAIIEASDTSGTLHQAAECARLQRWLFVAKSLADDERLTWPKKFLKNPKTAILTSTSDLMRTLLAERP